MKIGTSTDCLLHVIMCSVHLPPGYSISHSRICVALMLAVLWSGRSVVVVEWLNGPMVALRRSKPARLTTVYYSLYKTIIRHVLMYGSETWALRKAEQNLLDRTERWECWDGWWEYNIEDWKDQDRRNKSKGRCGKHKLENKRSKTEMVRPCG